MIKNNIKKKMHIYHYFKYNKLFLVMKQYKK